MHLKYANNSQPKQNKRRIEQPLLRKMENTRNPVKGIRKTRELQAGYQAGGSPKSNACEFYKLLYTFLIKLQEV